MLANNDSEKKDKKDKKSKRKRSPSPPPVTEKLKKRKRYKTGYAKTHRIFLFCKKTTFFSKQY